MEYVATDEAEPPFQVERRGDLAAEHGFGESGCMAVDGCNDRIRGLLALLVPAPPRSEVVAEVLTEERRDMLALRRQARVERRRDQHLDDRLLRPPMHRRVEIGAVHVI